MKAFLIFAFAAAFAAESFGVDAIWKNTATADQEWWTAANWKDATTGEELTEPPVTAGSTATFPDIDMTARRVNLLTAGVKDQNLVIDSIVGGECWQLALTGGNNTWGRYTRSVSVTDVNGFKGEWISYGSFQTLDFSNATVDQKLQVVYPHYHFPIKVPASITAEMGYVRGSTGAIAKEGDGKLKIGTVMDAETLQLQLNEGEVELAGVIGPEDEIIRKAYYHLDANLPDTMETYTDEAGRTRVTKWLDANGSGRFASTWDNSSDPTSSHFKFVNAPFITKNASTTGLSVMDFGSCSPAADQVEAYGPTNCTFCFSERLTNVCEILWISGWNNGTAPAFGDDSDYTFIGGATDIFSYGHTITNGGGAFWHNANYRAEMPLPPDSVGLRRFATPSDTYSPSYKDLRLCDIKLGTIQRIHYFATDRRYSDMVGGVKMGEVLVFTNALADAERQLVGNYLMKRWFANRPQSEFRNVYAADGTAISVPAGRTAKIDNLVARGTVTKKGAGTLVIGRTVQDPNLVVEEGDVRFETTTFDISDDAPAGTPQFWYDGDQADCFETDENGVTAWKDRRAEYATARQATRFVETGVDGYPQVDTTSCPGHTVLSFPAATVMSMPGKIGSGYAFQSEAFIVFAFSDSTGAADYNALPNGSYNFVRGAYRFLDPGSADDVAMGGVYTLDGVPGYAAEPASGNRSFEVGRWYVASASILAAGKMNGLARDGGRNRVGHLKVGEVITYSDALTEDQRRQTVAYLMKKWLGKDHPESQAPAVKPVLTFDVESPAVVRTEGNAEVQSVAGGNGNLVKKGVGDVTIVAELDESFGNVAVEDGSLSIAKPIEPPDRSVYHFDAMDAASFVQYFIDENGETNVSRWADTRANGVTAYTPDPVNPSGNDWMYMTNPIVRHVTFPDGQVRPILDFLTRNSRNVNPPTGAGFYLSNVSDCRNKIKEAHYIFGNGHDAESVFYGRSSCDFLRGLNGQLFRNGTQAAAVSADVQNGYISVNNQVTNSTAVLKNDNFYLVSVAPLSAKDISTIGADRADWAGGDRYGECIAFTDYLQDRERTYLQAKLMRKWIDRTAPEAVWTNELDSVTLGAGTTLSVCGGAVLVPTITGGGTIDAAKVLGIATLNLTVGEPLVVDGLADFAREVTVNLAGAVRLKPGSYTLVTATSFANLDLANWVLTSAPVKYQWVLRQDGDSVVLEVKKSGLAIIFR